MAARQTAVAVLAVLLIAAAAVAETSWSIGNTTEGTYPSQGHRLVKSGTNLYLVYDDNTSGRVLEYVYSSNSGTNWTSPELVELGDANTYDYRGCVAVDDNGKAWIMSAHMVAANSERLDGTVRRGASDYNYTNDDLALGGKCFHSISAALSPSGGSSPMVYAVASFTKPDPWGGPDSECLYFVAWDTTVYGYPREVPISISGLAGLYDVGSYDVRGSIAVSGHSGNDTIHVVYQGSDSRVWYRKSTNQVNPSRLRSGYGITWSDPVAVSTYSSPDCEPATNPSLELTGDSLFAVWRGPNNSGGSTGDIWLAKRRVYSTVSGWTTPANKSQSSSTESDYPTASTRYGIGWHEFISGSNYDPKALLDGHTVTIKSTGGDSASKYPHIAVQYSSSPYYVDCHTAWTEKTSSTTYKVWYKKYRYMPSLMGGDGGEGAWVRLGEGQSLVTAWPSPAAGRTQFAYYVQNDGPCRLELLDVQGRLVKTLVSGRSVTGAHRAAWDGRDSAGRQVSPGTYYCRMTLGSSVAGCLVTMLH